LQRATPSSRAVLLVALSLAGSILAATAFCWLFLHNVDIQLFFTQSDTLFLPALFSDLHRDLGSFQHWHFPAAPSYFPDLLIYAAADAVATDFRGGLFLFGMLQLLLLFFGSWQLTRELAPCRFPSFAVCFWAVFAGATLLSYLLGGPFAVRRFMYVMLPVHHFGAFLVGIYGLALVLAYLRRQRVWLLWLLAALTVATTLSDLIFVLYFVAPTLGLLIILLAEPPRLRAALRLFVVLAAAALVGHVAQKYLGNVGDLEAYAAVVGRSPWVSLRALVWLLMGENVGEVLFATAFLILPWHRMVRRAVVLVTSRLRRQPITLSPFEMFALYAVGAAAVIMAAVVYMGLLDTIRSRTRYLMPVNFLPVLWLVFLLTPRLQGYWGRVPSARRVVGIAGGAAVAAAGLVGAVIWGGPVSLAAVMPAPAAVQCFGYTQQAGFADYWMTKPLVMFSDHRLTVGQLRPDAKLLYWVSSDAWLDRAAAEAPDRPRPSFIYMLGLDARLIADQFGRPSRVVPCDGSEIWYYDDAEQLARRAPWDSPQTDFRSF
jgi:hypothetical protein